MAEEDHKERIDQELREFLDELRVTLPGVEIIFAFLLTVPFTERFHELGDGVRGVYFASVLCMALAAVLLIAAAVHHRLRFRTADKEQVLKTGTLCSVVATVLVAGGLTTALYVVGHVAFGGVVAAFTAALVGGVTALLWFGVPWLYRPPPHR